MPLPRTLLDRSQPSDADLSVVQGAWPGDLTGEIVISAPHPETFGGPHAFFGDGITYRLSLEPGTYGSDADRFAWRWAWIDSPSARLRKKRPDVFECTMLGVNSPFGFSNSANTAPLPWGDRLFMTWDVGRPVEIDPVTLGFLGEVGHRSEWKEFLPYPVLPMITSTAHPVIDPDRDCLWTVNTHWGQLHVVRWDGDGRAQSWPIEGALIPQSLHTITVTRDWIVVADCAFKVEPQMVNGGERTEPNNPTEPLYLIRKADLDRTAVGEAVPCRTFTVAPEVMHYYAVYDDSDGVRVVFEHTENSELGLAQRPGDVDALGRPCDPAFAGLYGFPMSPSRMSMIEFDPETGRQTERASLYEPERFFAQQLSALDWSTEGVSAPTVRHMLYHGWRPEAVTQRHLALYGDRVDRTLLPTEETPAVLATLSMPDLQPLSDYTWSVDDLPSSPIFVPRDPGSNGSSRYAGSRPGGHDGYVVVPVMSDAGFRVEVFDADDVGRGPRVTLAAPNHRVAFILHSAWMPRAVSSPDLEHTRFATELDGLAGLPDDLADVAREVARELDDGVPMAVAE